MIMVRLLCKTVDIEHVMCLSGVALCYGGCHNLSCILSLEGLENVLMNKISGTDDKETHAVIKHGGT